MKKSGGWPRKKRLQAKTELRSKTPLERTGSLPSASWLSRRTPLAAGQPKPKPAPKDTGPSSAVRHTVKSRTGMCCERCGCSVAAVEHHVHHRRPRQMGGDTRPGTNCPSNLLLLCTACHSAVESSRQISYEQGWLVHAEHNPAVQPVWLAGRGSVYLRADGTTAPVSRSAA